MTQGTDIDAGKGKPRKLTIIVIIVSDCCFTSASSFRKQLLSI